MFIRTINKKDKRAISVMIGYILLITFAIVIAGVVFQWLKTYVPKEGVDCPNGVSLYLSGYKVENKILTLNLRNNGKFSIGGVFSYYSNNSEQKIPSLDLSQSLISGGLKINPGIKFSGGNDNSFAPNSEDISINLNVSQIDYIYAIDLIPIRWQEEKSKIQSVSCTNAKTTKILNLNTDENILVEDLTPEENQANTEIENQEIGGDELPGFGDPSIQGSGGGVSPAPGE